jgi:octaprenyl-diphosphate synthase
LSGVVVAIEGGRGQKPGIEPLLRLVRPDMERVNALIVSKAGSDVELIPEIARHLIDSGGKRIRPMLTLAAAQMCGYSGEHHILLATAVEFMHTATLLHDDVVDESDMRRGKLAARMLWGNQASVLVGDFLLGQAFRMMVETGSLQALDVLSHAATVIAEGEVMQLSTAKNLETNEDEYLAVIRAKTAALFSAAAEVGPIVAQSPRATVSAFRSYGANLGLAFQLIDDALDYGGSSQALGKNVGDDFREGKVTLPVVLAYRRGTDAQRAFWRQAIEGGSSDADGLAEAIRLLRHYDAIADTVARARHYAEMARDALAPMKPGEHKDALLEVLEFCINRAN